MAILSSWESRFSTGSYELKKRFSWPMSWFLVLVSRAVVLKVCSPDRQHQHRLGKRSKCRFGVPILAVKVPGHQVLCKHSCQARSSGLQIHRSRVGPGNEIQQLPRQLGVAGAGITLCASLSFSHALVSGSERLTQTMIGWKAPRTMLQTAAIVHLLSVPIKLPGVCFSWPHDIFGSSNFWLWSFVSFAGWQV